MKLKKISKFLRPLTELYIFYGKEGKYYNDTYACCVLEDEDIKNLHVSEIDIVENKVHIYIKEELKWH